MITIPSLYSYGPSLKAKTLADAAAGKFCAGIKKSNVDTCYQLLDYYSMESLFEAIRAVCPEEEGKLADAFEDEGV